MLISLAQFCTRRRKAIIGGVDCLALRAGGLLGGPPRVCVRDSDLWYHHGISLVIELTPIGHE